MDSKKDLPTRSRRCSNMNSCNRYLRPMITVVMTFILALQLTACSDADAKIESLKIALEKEQSVREIEVSIWETASAVYFYLVYPSKMSLEEYKKQLADVKKFHSIYMELITEEEERQLAVKFADQWETVTASADELIQLRDRLDLQRQEAQHNVNATDDVIDFKIQSAFFTGVPQLHEKEKAVREIEVSLWEAINASFYYVASGSTEAKKEFSTQLEDIAEYWSQYNKLQLSSAEKPHIKTFDNSWKRSRDNLQHSIQLADELSNKFKQFWEEVHEVDDVIDFDIQQYLAEDIKAVTG